MTDKELGPGSRHSRVRMVEASGHSKKLPESMGRADFFLVVGGDMILLRR